MSANKEIRALANALPPYPKFDDQGNIRTIPVSRYFTGAQLMAKHKGPEPLRDKDGNPLNPKKNYFWTGGKPLLVNHFEELKKIQQTAKTPEEATVNTKAYIQKVMEYNQYTEKPQK